MKKGRLGRLGFRSKQMRKIIRVKPEKKTFHIFFHSQIIRSNTVLKVCRYGDFYGLYFLIFGLNTEIYGMNTGVLD